MIFLSFSLPFSCTEFGKKIFLVEDYNTKINFEHSSYCVRTIEFINRQLSNVNQFRTYNFHIKGYGREEK